MTTLTIPAREGRAFRVCAGRRFGIVTPHGRQAADFFAFNADNLDEWLSAPHTWTATRHLRPRAGDVFVSRFRRPLVRFAADHAGGIHDMTIAACDQIRYEQLGHEGPHANCADNLRAALQRIGRSVRVIPQPVNFFTHSRVDEDGRLTSPPNPVPAGASVTLEARLDLICVVSACPYDLKAADWPINAPEGPTELTVVFEEP